MPERFQVILIVKENINFSIYFVLCAHVYYSIDSDIVLKRFQIFCLSFCCLDMHSMRLVSDIFIPQVEYLPVIFPSEKKLETASEFAERVSRIPKCIQIINGAMENS